MKKKLSLFLVLMLIFSAVSASAATLRMNSKGEQVRKLQTKLKDLGYFKDTVDGKYGNSTWSAVWWYQKNNGLKVDGIAGRQTLSALGLETSKVNASRGLQYGDSGTSVSALQRALKALGYYTGNIDGKYSDATWSAVWTFQRDKGINPDGIAGSATLAKLSITQGSGYTPSFSGVKGLKYGQSGATVRALQNALKQKGYYKGTVDGKYGDSTWAAVWHFERDNNMPATGIAGTKVLAMLNISGNTVTAPDLAKGKTLKHGSSGVQVSALQTALKNLGLYNGRVDGKYGDATWSAVWWFQKNNGLKVTGIVDTTTWKALMK